MTKKGLLFAPREIFENILEYAVIPTIDLIVWFNGLGCVLLHRRISPYKNIWALPGLRMMKPEGIGDTIARIARNEIGIDIDFSNRKFVGQYVGRFRSEQNRQDLSTCYAIFSNSSDIIINSAHFSNHRFIKEMEDMPAKTGAMYAYYLKLFFAQNKFEFDKN